MEPYTKFTPDVDESSTVVNPIVPRAAPPDMLLKFRLTTSKRETSLRSPEAFLTNATGWLVISSSVGYCEFKSFLWMFSNRCNRLPELTLVNFPAVSSSGRSM